MPQVQTTNGGIRKSAGLEPGTCYWDRRRRRLLVTLEVTVSARCPVETSTLPARFPELLIKPNQLASSKYLRSSVAIHLPTGTDTPFPIIRYASLVPPANVNVSGTPCSRAYSRTVYGRTPRGKPLVGNEARAQIFGVVRDAGGCDVATFWIADDWLISILAGETSVYIIRNVWSWFGLEYLSERDRSLSRWFTPSEVPSTADDDQPVSLLR